MQPFDVTRILSSSGRLTTIFRSITVLDVSEKALATSRDRLGPRAQHVTWVVADVTAWRPDESYDLWHDRATFHFLTDPSEARQDCSNRTRLCGVGGSGFAITLANPAARPMASNSRAVYASPCGVEPSI